MKSPIYYFELHVDHSILNFTGKIANFFWPNQTCLYLELITMLDDIMIMYVGTTDHLGAKEARGHTFPIRARHFTGN